MQNKLIAIGGYKNSGKNTVASMLQYLFNSPKILHSYIGYKLFAKFYTNGKFKITSFAHPLKRTLAALLDIDINKFEDRVFKETYYIYFPTLTITNKPDYAKVISEGKFSRMINNKDLSFLKTNYITIRQLLQVFGTECMRNIFGDKIWILSTLKQKGNLIISDLRFKTEYYSIKALDGITIMVDNPNCKPGNHISEQEINELSSKNCFTLHIYNDGTNIKELFSSVLTVYKDLQNYL